MHLGSVRISGLFREVVRTDVRDTVRADGDLRIRTSLDGARVVILNDHLTARRDVGTGDGFIGAPGPTSTVASRGGGFRHPRELDARETGGRRVVIDIAADRGVRHPVAPSVGDKRALGVDRRLGGAE